MKTVKLDKEEQELLKSFERGEWKSVENLKDEIRKHQEYARKTMKKDKRNITGRLIEKPRANKSLDAE